MTRITAPPTDKDLADAEKIARQCEEIGWVRPDAPQLAEIARLGAALGFKRVRKVFNNISQFGDHETPVEDAILTCRRYEKPFS